MFTKTFALLHRGLRHDARLLKVHLLRMGMVLIVVGMLFITHFQSMLMGSPGLSFFKAITLVTFFFATLSSATLFPTAITEEKEEQTLGLLALANISPLALIMGKFLPRMAGALLILSALFPFTLLSITLGGVTWNQIWAAYWTLLSHVILIGTLGLLCSVVCRRSSIAVLITVLGVIGFLTLPPLVASILSTLPNAGVTVPAADQLQAWSASAVNTSAFLRIRDIMQTGFNEGPFGLQVVSNLAGAALLFLGAWALFGPFNRLNESATETGTWFSRGARLTRTSRRCWRWPVAWKDFYYLVGGPAGWGVRAILYVVAAVVAGVVVNGFRYDDELRPTIGQCLMAVAASGVALELLLTGSCLFPAEIRQGTWPGLATLPVPIGHVALGKVGGACLGLVPAVLCLLAGGLIAIETLLDGKLALALLWVLPFATVYLVLLHLIVLYSLLLNQWVALPLALLTLFVASCFTGGWAFMAPAISMAASSSGNAAEFAFAVIVNLVYAVVAIGISFGLEVMIAQRLRVMAGR